MSIKKFVVSASLLAGMILAVSAVSVAAETEEWDCGATEGTVTCVLTDDGTLTVSGSGAMKGYDPMPASGGPTTPWHQAHKNSDGYSTNPIKQVIIADGVTTVGRYAFAHCVNLESVTIPASVTVIGERAFHDCKVLTLVTSKNPVPPTLQADVFNDISLTAELLVPNANVDVYAENQDWIQWFGAIGYITVIDVWDCGATAGTVACTLFIDGTLTVSGSGAMRNYDPVEGSGGPTTPWHQAHKNSDGYSTNPIKQVIIADGVTTIGHYAFAHCVNMTSVTIPASVAVIGKNAFYRCNVLASVTSNNPVPPTLQADVFLEINEDAVLKVPSASVETYKADEGWNSAFNNSIVADGPSSIGNAVRAAQSVATGPRATVRNRTLVVRASTPTATARVRLIDMRGKSVASFTAKGNGNFALTKIPAGRYFVEVREGAKRERGSVVIGVR